MNRIRRVVSLAAALMLIAESTAAFDRAQREVDPNPLLMVSDAQFWPLAEAVVRFEMYSGSDCAQLVYLTAQQRQQFAFAPKSDPQQCRQRILGAVRPAATTILKGLPGQQQEPMNADTLLLDPRVYQRVVMAVVARSKLR